jgi:drug/metabolite transporter (DMT)-like permease
MMRLYSALIGLSLIWGMSFVFIKWITDAAGVWGTVFFRCLAGILILLPLLWWKRKQIASTFQWRHVVIVGLFNAGLPWGLIALSETQIHTSTASVLNALTPIFTGLIGFLFFSKKLTRQQWMGILLGFCGILILTEFQIHMILGENFIGMGTMVLATLCYGFASQYAKQYLQQMHVLLISTCTLLVGTLTGLVGMIVTNTIPTQMEFNGTIILSIIGLGCFGSGIAYLLFYFLMIEGSPEFATTVTYLIPVTAIMWGYVLMKEPITQHLLIGLFIILVGIYFTNRKPKIMIEKTRAHSME